MTNSEHFDSFLIKVKYLIKIYVFLFAPFIVMITLIFMIGTIYYYSRITKLKVNFIKISK